MDSNDLPRTEEELNLEHNLLIVQTVFVENILTELMDKSLIEEEEFIKSMHKMKDKAQQLQDKESEIRSEMLHYMLLVENLLDVLSSKGVDKNKILKKTKEQLKKSNIDLDMLAKEEKEKISKYIW
jgi:seryl-tRNA synthetase